MMENPKQLVIEKEKKIAFVIGPAPYRTSMVATAHTNMAQSQCHNFLHNVDSFKAICSLI